MRLGSSSLSVVIGSILYDMREGFFLMCLILFSLAQGSHIGMTLQHAGLLFMSDYIN
jgi:hypothetical protein